MRKWLTKIDQINRTESIIYLLMWLLMFTGSLFSILSNLGELRWSRIYIEWIRLTPFIIIFLINTTILAPYLLLKKRLVYYLISVSVLVTVIVLLSTQMHLLISWLFDHPNGSVLPRRPIKAKSDLLGERLIMAILIIGLNNTIKLLIQRQKEDKQHEEQKKLLLQTELSFLRNQIGPHFFMNTLNNIHALIAIDPDKAGRSVIRLSELMRHMLNEGTKEKASIKAEFGFLNSYINLMRLRCSKRVRIDVAFQVEDSDRMIPSFLFVSIVENAFKYGVDYSKPSFIEISATIVDDYLIFKSRNSKNIQIETAQKTGIGLENLQKQLHLLYETAYDLSISDEPDQFNIQLKIPIGHD
ncbi:sensor histidine kinase [Mangrovibacterium sp.]|uniref:sensor histidine kinase n=1 Tax=Mangrovibacterium sp. TaxID=1961364 RepID=UPI003562409E